MNGRQARRAPPNVKPCCRQCAVARLVLLCLVGLLAAGFKATGLYGAPVTGWHKDTSFGGGGGAALSDAGTDSPVLGSGAANNADNVAIYAEIPLVALAHGQRIALTGSAEMVGSSANGDFRWGLFKDNEVAPVTAGWLGYIASAQSVVWSKDPAGSDFSAVTFASIASGRGNELGTMDEPNGNVFESGTYHFNMTVDRFGDEADIRIAITDDEGRFNIATPAFTEGNPARRTFDFDRVGFLAGSALNADQVRFRDVDVTVSDIEAPTLQVHSSGQVFISNAFGQAFDLTYYEITSDSGALSKNGWTSLDDQENNDPIGTGWEEAGGSGANILAEVHLISSSPLEGGSSMGLGQAFTVGGTQDLAFRYITAHDEQVRRGLVEYVLSGDYNRDGVVSATDYVVWRDSLGETTVVGAGGDGDGNGIVAPADYQVWQDNFGAAADAGVSQTVAVPEPDRLTMLLLAMCAAIGRCFHQRLRRELNVRLNVR